MHTLFNLDDYTITQHFLFAIGAFLWVVAYVKLIFRFKKIQFIEIPLIAICANFSWEFLWGFVFKTNMGTFYQWGYRLWFILDIFIVYALFKYGKNQFTLPQLKGKALSFILFGMASWAAFLYFFIDEYDLEMTHMGAFSGYILNTMMSALYPVLFLKLNQPKLFSRLAGWSKGVGTFLISIFCFLKFPEYGWLLVMCVVTTLLDAWYIFLIETNRSD